MDGDGDGRADIWTSPPDTLASIANYFVQAGWRPGEPWGVAVSVPAGLARDQVRDHFGIGLRAELAPFRQQHVAQRLEILDDAVVYDRNAVGGVRVGVHLRRGAMRRPTGVADARAAFQRDAEAMYAAALAARSDGRATGNPAEPAQQRPTP